MRRRVSGLWLSLLLSAVGLALGTAGTDAWAQSSDSTPSPPIYPPTPPCGSGPRVVVVVDGLRSARGDAVVELYPDDQNKFLHKFGRLAQVRYRLDSTAATVCLPAPSARTYAVSVYQDENRDGIFNKNSLGLPTEGFGVSNNPSVLFGKPPFRAVRIKVPDGAITIHIKLHYL